MDEKERQTNQRGRCRQKTTEYLHPDKNYPSAASRTASWVEDKRECHLDSDTGGGAVGRPMPYPASGKAAQDRIPCAAYHCCHVGASFVLLFRARRALSSGYFYLLRCELFRRAFLLCVESTQDVSPEPMYSSSLGLSGLSGVR